MNTFKKLIVMSVLSLLGQAAHATMMGVVFHDDGAYTPAQIVSLLKSRSINHVRMDIRTKSGSNRAVSDRMYQVISELKDAGIAASVIIHTIPAYRARTGYCPGESIVLEQQAKDDAYQQVYSLKELVRDFEMGNEVPLYPNIQGPSSAPYVNAATFDTPCGRTMASILRGTAAAVKSINNSFNKNLRTILGVVDNGSVGFLKFMQSKGVDFDIVGYHTYPSRDTPDLNNDRWYAPSGGAIGLLKQFNKPIHINEFNCGEIYGDSVPGGFINATGSDGMNRCLASIEKHLPEILTQKDFVEVIDMYELFDEPKASICPNMNSPRRDGAECRFGLMRDINNPKPLMDVVERFAKLMLADATQGQPKPVDPSPTPSLPPVVKPPVIVPPVVVIPPVTTPPVVSPPVVPIKPTIPPSTTEFNIQPGLPNDAEYISHSYRILLGREPVDVEHGSWQTLMSTGLISRKFLQNGMRSSPEFLTKVNANNYVSATSLHSLSQADFTILLFKVLLNRVPAKVEVNAWLASNPTLESRPAMLRGFLTSTEYQNKTR